MIRVVFLTYLEFPLEIGGFQNQVRQIFKKLNVLGVSVDWYDINNTNLSNYDILHVFATSPSFLPVIRKAKNLGLKIVLTPMVAGRTRSNLYKKIVTKLSLIPHFFERYKDILSVINSADYLVPLSDFEALRLKDVYNVPLSKMKVIPNGIDDVFFEKNIENIELPFEDYFLIVGRIEPNKNQLEVIKAVNKLGEKLIIVGEPGNADKSYYKRCKSLSGSNIMYYGKVTSFGVLKQLYKNARCSVIASLSEMVPLVIFESLKMGTPVICTNRCSITNLQISGLVFSKIDYNSLAIEMDKIKNFDKKQIDNTGVFSWMQIAEEYYNIYESITR